MSSPSTPSPAAHHFARLCQHSGKGRAATSSASGRCHRHHIATTSEPIDQQPATTGQRLDVLPSCPPRPFPCPSLLSVAITVHALASSSLPSSSAVPVIHRPDLVRSLSSVRPSVFLFLVPRSPSCLLTAKANASRSLSHQVTPSPEREGFTPSCSGRDTIATTSTPTSNRDGHTSARPSASLSLPVW